MAKCWSQSLQRGHSFLLFTSWLGRGGCTTSLLVLMAPISLQGQFCLGLNGTMNFNTFVVSSVIKNGHRCTKPTGLFFACRSVGNSSMSLSRCSCCEVRSSLSWTSSSPTPRGANLCPSYSFSSHMDLCLGPLALDGQGQSGGELSTELFSHTSWSPSFGSVCSIMLAEMFMAAFCVIDK